jgi:hypothetical protein
MDKKSLCQGKPAVGMPPLAQKTRYRRTMTFQYDINVFGREVVRIQKRELCGVRGVLRAGFFPDISRAGVGWV